MNSRQTYSKRKNSQQQQAASLLKALPNFTPEDANTEHLAQLIAEIDAKQMPTSSFHRSWILGSVSAKVTLGYLITRLRSCFSDMDRQHQLYNETHMKAAFQLFGAMGYLRGAVMKVGQLLANLPEVTPEQFHDILNALHFNAPPMHYAMVADVFLDELGKAPEEIFASFERKAFAAASLGQVHRARLHSGEEVAVKIQYPDIATTINSDLQLLRLLLQPLRFSKGWPGIRDKLDDLEQMLQMETDYIQEAEFSQKARQLFQREDGIIVPKVYPQFSTQRVLTTEFLPGQHLRAFLNKQPTQQQRDHYSRLLAVATLRIYMRKQWFFTDSHPGNFIFMPDGQLGFIDFGSIRSANSDEMEINNRFEQAFLDNTQRAMESALRDAYGPAFHELSSDVMKLIMDFSGWQMQPWKYEGLFDYGDQLCYKEGMNQLLELVSKGVSSDRSLYLWSIRSVIGARALVYQLKGKVNFHELVQQEKAGAGKI